MFFIFLLKVSREKQMRTKNEQFQTKQKSIKTTNSFFIVFKFVDKKKF